MFLEDDTRHGVEFRAVASSIAGETAGHTSEFEYRQTLFSVEDIDRIVIPKLYLHGMIFEDIVVGFYSHDGVEKLKAVANEN